MRILSMERPKQFTSYAVGLEVYSASEMDEYLRAMESQIHRMKNSLKSAIHDLEHGFVRCERCGHEESSTTLDAYSLLQAALAFVEEPPNESL